MAPAIDAAAGANTAKQNADAAAAGATTAKQNADAAADSANTAASLANQKSALVQTATDAATTATNAANTAATNANAATDAANTAANTASTAASTATDAANTAINSIMMYDCSAKGTITFATLDLAIAAVPLAYQKGGLHIKFVDTVSNKYNTYFLKTPTWSTSTADWQYSNENIEYAKNGTGVTVPKGKVVYINSSTDENPIFQLATNADYAIAARTWGMTYDGINANDVGKIIHFGMIENIDTSAYTVGTELWLGTNGEYTNVRPTSPVFQTSIGMVIRQSATVGSIFVNIRYVNIEGIRSQNVNTSPSSKLFDDELVQVRSDLSETTDKLTELDFELENKSSIYDSDDESALCISDGNGNVIIELSKGHIKTKEFDSARINTNQESNNKILSVLADSISSFSGVIPNGYLAWYPTYSHGTITQDDMWWQKLANDLGLQIGSICAWSGSKCSGDAASTTNASAGCSDKRVADLSIGGIPDIIVVFIGINDFLRQIPIGDWDYTTAVPANERTDIFSVAYSLMISKIITNYPNAKVFCCTLLQEFNGQENPSYPIINKGGVYLHEYNNKIKEIANYYGCTIIDLHSCGINQANIKEMTFSSNTNEWLHPTKEGQRLIYRKVKNTIINNI